MKTDISKYRFLELKYFCLQYPEYVEKLKLEKSRTRILEKQNEFSDPTGDSAVKIATLNADISIIENAAKNSDTEIGEWIFLAAAYGYSFKTLKMIFGLPCERDMFYDRRRRFYILLDKIR